MSDDVDGDIPQILQQWGLPPYIDTFEVNNITISTLSMLDSSLDKELIPPIGDQAKFLKNLDNWNKLTNPEECPEILPSARSSPAPVFVDLLNPKHKQIKSMSEFLISLNNNNTSTQLNDSDVIIVAATSEDQVATTSEDQDITICNGDISYSPLKSLLLKSNEGRGLLNLYSEQGKLSNNGQSNTANMTLTLDFDEDKLLPKFGLIENISITDE